MNDQVMWAPELAERSSASHRPRYMR